ncbi:uncharacterized protein LOC134248027 isoform X1 [Saccostrea cucullata]|uniref:uncharacterized protein LOC134248027 isoform X1 n=1 Tax=Saccostrea cuccullata TaxID=36930 RepID=UPI002ED43ADE
MSEREHHKGKYIAVDLHDVEPLIDNSEGSTKSMCFFCVVISKISTKCGELRRWICRKIPFYGKIDKDSRCPFRFKQCLFDAICATFGCIFCKSICTGLCIFLYGCCIKPIGFHLPRLLNRPHEESIESQQRFQYEVEVEKLKEECVSLHVRLSDSQTDVKTKEAKLHEREEDLKEVRRVLEDERREKNLSNSKLYESQIEIKRLETRLQEERYEKENALKKVEEEKSEKEKALTRLSAVAGDKLRLNNPGIADLSDENRPNKLAEKFSELYDNEWTEVFEVLEGENFEEEKIIQMLLEVLKEIYNSCLRYARDQRENLIEAIAKPSKSKVQLEVEIKN